LKRRHLWVDKNLPKEPHTECISSGVGSGSDIHRIVILLVSYPNYSNNFNK